MFQPHPKIFSYKVDSDATPKHRHIGMYIEAGGWPTNDHMFGVVEFQRKKKMLAEVNSFG